MPSTIYKALYESVPDSDLYRYRYHSQYITPVWMTSVNREYSQGEYDSCYEFVKKYVPHVKIPYQPADTDSFRHLVNSMLPPLVTCYQRFPRTRWRDCVTPNGKHWIEQDDLPPEKSLRSMIGYDLAREQSLLGMAMVHGPQEKVVNIGLSIQKHEIPSHTTISSYIESLSHKLTPLELAAITAAPDPDATLRRLSTILALKSSYVKATGQNATFDWTRLEFDVDNKSATVDGHALKGWEFRLYRTKLGMTHGTEVYQCCTAFFQGCDDLKLVWYDDPKQLESWVQFINIDQILELKDAYLRTTKANGHGGESACSRSRLVPGNLFPSFGNVLTPALG